MDLVLQMVEHMKDQCGAQVSLRATLEALMILDDFLHKQAVVATDMTTAVKRAVRKRKWGRATSRGLAV